MTDSEYNNMTKVAGNIEVLDQSKQSLTAEKKPANARNFRSNS